MVCLDLQAVPELPLPEGLTLRPVRRLLHDPPDHVPLAEALLAHLRSLPAEPRLFAAVDDDGVVCGTSGSQASSSDAYVFFVNTRSSWRRRGVGLAMTATALRAAHRLGASRACLDASAAGVPLYQRLGFTTAGAMTQFTRSN
jgi:GNAT superfamily N-acetyltransferase